MIHCLINWSLDSGIVIIPVLFLHFAIVLWVPRLGWCDSGGQRGGAVKDRSALVAIRISRDHAVVTGAPAPRGITSPRQLWHAQDVGKI